MKTLYILPVMVGFFSVSAVAQQLHSDIPAIHVGPTEVDHVRQAAVQRSGNRELLWAENFADGFDSENGEWIKENEDAIWEYTTTVAPACWSASGEAAVNFTTKENGFMIFHPDEVNCIDGELDPPLHDSEIYEGALISPPIDLSENPAVLVSFEHRFRYCCSSNFELQFSVSSDDGATWMDYNITGGTPVNIYNTEILTSLNISQFAGGQSAVRLKFSWNTTGTASHYFWALDDIVVEIPVDTDLKLVDQNYQQYDPNTAVDYADVKHSIYQSSQVRPLNLQGFAVNNGALEQENVYMTATIVTPTETINLDAPAQTIAVGDTGIFEIPYTPDSEVGEYMLAYHIVTETEDENPGDNSDTLYFSVDENHFARDDRSRSGSFTNYVDELRTALGFTLTEDATIYGIAFALDAGSDHGTIYNGQLLDDDFNFISETDFVPVDTNDLNEAGDENFVELALAMPYQAFAGESIFPAFSFFGGEEVANISLSGVCPDFTCYVWASIASDGQLCNPCYYNSVPMIRPLFAETVGLAESVRLNGITLGQNVPNPARDYTVIVFDFVQHEENVVFEIHDLQGRQVYFEKYGTLPSGQHTRIIPTQGLSAGLYIYSLKTSTQQQSKRMTVLD